MRWSTLVAPLVISAVVLWWIERRRRREAFLEAPNRRAVLEQIAGTPIHVDGVPQHVKPPTPYVETRPSNVARFRTRLARDTRAGKASA